MRKIFILFAKILYRQRFLSRFKDSVFLRVKMELMLDFSSALAIYIWISFVASFLSNFIWIFLTFLKQRAIARVRKDIGYLSMWIVCFYAELVTIPYSQQDGFDSRNEWFFDSLFFILPIKKWFQAKQKRLLSQ